MPNKPTPSDLSGDTAKQAGVGLPAPELAAEAIAQLLQPMARLMIGHGLQLPTLVDLLKKALVDEAAKTYGLADKGSSDTRISLLTGVHRKDVRRLRAAPVTQAPSAPMVPLAASVVARWISEPRFLNADQTPRPLARTPGRNLPGMPDFTTLVAEVSRDVGARAVLDELVRLGVVALQDDGFVVLKANSLVPHEGLEESFQILAANISEHLSATVHNLAPDRVTPLKLEQCAYSQDLSKDQAEQLHQMARRLWGKALQQFLQMATVAEERSAAEPGPRYSVRFGVYFNDRPQDGQAQDAKAPDAPRKKARKSKP